MSRFRVRATLLIAVIAVLGTGSPAGAQSAEPVASADFAGTIGWLVVHRESPGPYDARWHSSLFGAVGAGWYWTDHLKTEVDFGGGTENRAYRVTPVTIDGRPNYVPRISRFSSRTLGISQQYQFFRNVWFHPHVAAGANIDWERTIDEFQPLVVYDGSVPRVIEPGRVDGPHTEVVVRPFVATGFKAYMTQRGFFRCDLRLALRGGVDDVLLRVGFGVDF